MIRFLIVRILFPLILLLFIRAVFRSLAANFHAAKRAADSEGSATGSRNIPAAGELKKDPVCGTYVSTASSLTRTVNGQVLHFCSEECRHKYRAA
jgi:YHS domain-containing protein